MFTGVCGKRELIGPAVGGQMCAMLADQMRLILISMSVVAAPSIDHVVNPYEAQCSLTYNHETLISIPMGVAGGAAVSMSTVVDQCLPGFCLS